MSALHPRMTEVITTLREAQLEMNQLLDSVSPDVATRAPSASAWSVAQIVEHLAIVEDGTGRLVSKLIKQVEGTTDTASAAEPLLPAALRERAEDALTNPIVAPDMVTPRGTLTFLQAREMQATARERLIAALTAASGRALHEVSFPHPVLGVLHGYQWAVFPALHQRRHLHQLRRTLAVVAI